MLPNAPKKQPCDECDAWVRRIKQGPQFAVYHCSRHGDLIISLKQPRPKELPARVIKKLRTALIGGG